MVSTCSWAAPLEVCRKLRHIPAVNGKVAMLWAVKERAVGGIING
ncbi:MAG: Uncharacterised protein [Rhodobiaceae bacterium UBA7378]|nr:MAG: Uncharacterised protein [Rhodobiaceae bacterium UBA7378]